MFLPGHESIIVVVTEPMQLKFVLTDVRVYAQAEQLRVELWDQPKLAKQSLAASSASSQWGARRPSRLRTRNFGCWRPPACSGRLLRADTSDCLKSSHNGGSTEYLNTYTGYKMGRKSPVCALNGASV